MNFLGRFIFKEREDNIGIEFRWYRKFRMGFEKMERFYGEVVVVGLGFKGEIRRYLSLGL